jgi:hypothetical protein
MSSCTPFNFVDSTGSQHVFVNAKYFIDSQFGNDATAVLFDSSRPFQTIQAVIDLVQPGETVYIQPGNYSSPDLALNGATWYFSPNSVFTGLVTGSGNVFGYGTFIGQSPCITLLGSTVYFQAFRITTPSDYAIYIDNSSLTIDVVSITSPDGGFYLAGNSTLHVTLGEYNGGLSGTFINADSPFIGEVVVDCQKIECNTGIRSTSNRIIGNIYIKSVKSNGDYFLQISDPVGTLSSFARFNISIGRIHGVGLINMSGINGLLNPNLQPRVNLNIQTITCPNNNANQIILLEHAILNFTFDTFNFTYFTPIDFIIEIGNFGILHISGKQCYNLDQPGAEPAGFARINSPTFGLLKIDIIELYITGAVLDIIGAASTAMFVQTLNNTVQSSAIIGISNSSECIINIINGQFIYPDGSRIVNNLGLMRFDVNVLRCTTNNSQIIYNQNQMQARPGFFVVNGSGNTAITTTGSIMGIICGSLRLVGTNNTAMMVQGRTIMEIGQILGNIQPDNVGIIVEDPGQLFGRIGRLIMFNRTCIEFRSTLDSNVSFDWMTNGTEAYVISVAGQGEVTMRGNSITAGSIKFPIFVTIQKGIFNLNLLRMDVQSCEAGIYIETPDSVVNINIQKFEGGPECNAAVVITSGTLTLAGNYYMRSASGGALINVFGDASLNADLGFVDTSNTALIAQTTGNVWYSSTKTISEQSDNVIYNGSGELTVDGYFKTNGDYNIRYFTQPSIARVLNATLISNGINIHSDGPFINFVCNGAIGNTGLSNAATIPAGQFFQDIGVQ